MVGISDYGGTQTKRLNDLDRLIAQIWRRVKAGEDGGLYLMVVLYSVEAAQAKGVSRGNSGPENLQ